MSWSYPVDSHHGHTDKEPPGSSLSHTLSYFSSGGSPRMMGSDTLAHPLAKIWVPLPEQIHFSYQQGDPTPFQLEASRRNASEISASYNFIGINSTNYYYVSDDEHVSYDPKEAVSSQYPWSRSSSIHLPQLPGELCCNESTDQPDHRNLPGPIGYAPATSVSSLYHGSGAYSRDCAAQITPANHHASFEAQDTVASTIQDPLTAFCARDNEPISSSLLWNNDQQASLEVYCHHEPISASQYSSYSELTANILYLSEIKRETKTNPGNLELGDNHDIIAAVDAQQATTPPNTGRLSPILSQATSQITQTSRASPIQSTERRTQAKRSSDVKKMNLACLFCRERKIACGRPKDGSTDQTCNQCERRSFKCEYPTISRRGQHKRPRKSGSGSEG